LLTLSKRRSECIRESKSKFLLDLVKQHIISIILLRTSFNIRLNVIIFIRHLLLNRYFLIYLYISLILKSFSPLHHFDAIYQAVVLLVLSQVFCEIFEFSSEHASHHISFEVIDVVALKLAHHLFDLPICNAPHHGISAFHKSHWVKVVVI
jgi:hypothetical protein